MKRASRAGVWAAVAGVVVTGLPAVVYAHADSTNPDTLPQTSRPLLAVVGASISAGSGAKSPDQAYPALLATQLGWQSEVSAEPGAGYIARGKHRLGPMLHLLAKLQLTLHQPRMVIVQAGYNDIGEPPSQLADSVRAVIGEIQAQAPDAAIGVLTIFPKGRASPAAWATDTLIVDAARDADRHVYVFDPLASRWTFPTQSDREHPTAGGQRWIAERLASEFRKDGLIPAAHG
ncbi:SGNH/GDSL hydrolase family protein [Nocardia alni]|uniref:SGNH/GDSL hydrolase family protein n=1 Tax=Nocardia alni TaxID=2815723 RepID=UPI001C213B51|nr:SGNH/GDSL hydrolase family protein [Nocardia alni]